MIYEPLPVVDEETGDEYRPDGFELILSGSLDGVASLEELSGGLRGIADRLDELAAEGFQLDRPIEDGRGDIVQPMLWRTLAEEDEA